MRLYEREPAARFDDAHLLGNGRLGASIYGGVPFEEILTTTTRCGAAASATA